MDLKLNGRVALVSAASKGLGKAAAWALAREGADLVIAARGDVALAQTAAEIHADTGRAVLAVTADVSQAPTSSGWQNRRRRGLVGWMCSSTTRVARPRASLSR